MNKKSVIQFYSSDKLKLKLIQKQRGVLLFKVYIKDESQMEQLLRILKNKKITHVVIENLESVLKNKMDKIEIINKFTLFRIKCIELQGGYNNYNLIGKI